MDKTVRSKALLAALKVTLGASAFACGGAALTEAEEGPYVLKDASIDAPRDASKGDAVSVDAKVSDAKPTSMCKSATTKDGGTGAFACCRADLVKYVDEKADPPSTIPDTDDDFACCEAIIDGYYDWLNGQFDTDAGESTWGDPVHQVFRTCCQTFTRYNRTPDAGPTHMISDYQQSTCTPWGPPTPPSMPRARRNARRLRRETTAAGIA